jgi:hypothetical protein
MTEQRGFKKLVRERMARTGESYTTARRHVLAKAARAQAPGVPDGLVYAEFGTYQHHEASLIRHALGSVHDEALVAGLAGGIGFMYFVFEYQGLPPMLTIVAQHHPKPWVQTALDRLHVPYDIQHSGKPQWVKLRKALDAGHPVFCAVDKSRLPWHGMEPGFGTDPYTVVIAGYDGDTLYVDDESAAPHAIGTEEFGAAWSAYKKGRHQMIVPTGQATGDPDIDGAIAATAGHLTGLVLGNNFDVNFGFSGMEKLATQLRDTRTKTGWSGASGSRCPSSTGCAGCMSAWRWSTRHRVRHGPFMPTSWTWPAGPMRQPYSVSRPVAGSEWPPSRWRQCRAWARTPRSVSSECS